MTKQTRDIVVLVAGLIILAVAIVFQVASMRKANAPAAPPPAATTPAPGDPVVPAPAAPAATPAAAPAAATPGEVAWVDTLKVAKLTAQVQKGRNPFKGEMAKKTTDAKPSSNIDNPSVPSFPDGGPGGPFPLEKEIKLMRRLEWITPQELAQAFAGANLAGVKLMARKGSDQVIIIGMGQENFDKAVALATAVDVPPPAPIFQLKGIVSAEDGRYVALRVDGQFYTLKEGSVIPNVGWVVTRITPKRVTLSKDKQSVQLQLAGGHV
ncbi:MAG: hypothetical protein ACYC7E_08830 [Armatimonadota bacterium]